MKHHLHIENKTGLTKDTKVFTKDGHRVTGVRSVSIPRVSYKDDLIVATIEVIATVDVVAFLDKLEKAEPINPQGEKKDA